MAITLNKLPQRLTSDLSKEELGDGEPSMDLDEDVGYSAAAIEVGVAL